MFVYDRPTGKTSRVSVGTGGTQGDGYSAGSALSADGRYVAFSSAATNLVPGDTNGYADVFVHDLVTGATELVSGEGGTFPVDHFATPARPAGRCHASSPFLLRQAPPGDEPIEYEAIHDRRTGTTRRVAQVVGGEPNASTWRTFFTADGRFAGFTSAASNLVPGDTNKAPDVFVTRLPASD